MAVEKVAVAKEVIEDWNEQRKEAAQRKAYDREKDTRYTDAAQNAVETLENRGVVAANDDYEVGANRYTYAFFLERISRVRGS